MKKGFTLAEVLITLAIIGVVAALTIPSVIANTQQQEFKTGLKKAVSVLNSAITMNIAIDGESPRENADLFHYFQRHMSVIRSTEDIKTYYYGTGTSSTRTDRNGNTIVNPGQWIENAAFYTTDGMRFEFPLGYQSSFTPPELYETGVELCTGIQASGIHYWEYCGGCGSYGLKPDDEDWGEENDPMDPKAPCLIMVDVNGDRKPYPHNVDCHNSKCSGTNIQKYADPNGKRLTDLFTIMITDKQAIPYGVAAQKAMYEAQK